MTIAPPLKHYPQKRKGNAMSRSALPEGRVRRSITFDQSVLDRFQSLAARMGMPSTTLSAVCNDAVAEVNNVLALGFEQGKLDMEDIFRLMGKQVETLLEEERTNNAAHEKRLAAARRKKVA